MNVMPNIPPLIICEPLAISDQAPRLDLALTRQDLESNDHNKDSEPALAIPAAIEPGFPLKHAKSKSWFWSLVLASLSIHAALLIVSSMWDRHSEVYLADESIPVELVMEQSSPLSEFQQISEPAPELAAVEPVPQEPLVQETLPSETLAQAQPLPEPALPAQPLEPKPNPQDKPDPVEPEKEIKSEEPSLIEPVPEPAPITAAEPLTAAETMTAPEPAPIIPPQPVNPPPARKPAPPMARTQIATPARPPAISESRLSDFRATLSRKLSSAFRYPPLARERNKTGTVSVTFELDPNGNVTKASVVQSSGHEELDADALATIRRAAPFEPPPPGAPRSYTFPIVYRLR